MLSGSGTPWLAPPDLQAGPWDASQQCLCRLSCVTVCEDQGVWVQLRSCPGGRAQRSRGGLPAWSWGARSVLFWGRPRLSAAACPPPCPTQMLPSLTCVPPLSRHSWPPA